MPKTEVNSINIAYNRFGTGSRKCIMLHGNRDRKEHFSDLAEKMAREWDVQIYALDFRGHGESDKPESGYTIETFVSDIASFIKAHNLKDVVLIGHSLGSTVSIMLASQYPEQFSKLILLGAAAEFKIKFKRPEFTKENFKEMIAMTNKRAGQFFFTESSPESVKERVFDSWSRMEFHVHMNLIKLQHPDLKEAAKQIEHDTLLIYGEKDGSTTVEHGKILNKLLKNSHLSVIPDTAHFMYMEDQPRVLEQIQTFLG